MRQIDLIKLYGLKRCLIIDDMPDVRVAISGILRVFGVQNIDVVANGEQAMEACNNTEYQLVLCDYNLGGGRDGQQVLEELRFRNRLNNTSIFVMITAESSLEMVLGALEYQPDDYITKPITTALLRQRLDRVLIRHQELYDIKHALDEKDYLAAERHCQALLDNNTIYKNACLQIQAEMNLRLFNFKRAETIYTNALAERPMLWAKLGLGKTQVAKKEFDKAEQNLREVIETDHRLVEAHDLLAESYLGLGDPFKAQQAIQSAANISPKSVFRQRRLAILAKINEDTDACLEASRQAIKVARNSCHESADDYFNLARELIDLSALDNSEKYNKETFDILGRLERRPCFDVSAGIQVNSIKSRSLLNQFKNSESEKLLGKAKKVYDEKKDEVKPGVGLDVAQCLIAHGDKKAADELLTHLVERFPNNLMVTAKADAMSDTPKSKEGLQKVTDMTKTGIDNYEEDKYSDAIKTFEEAVVIFPSHIGLNLNLVQCIVAEVKKNGVQLGFESTCRKSLRRLSSISPDDAQYSRYLYLMRQIDELF